MHSSNRFANISIPLLMVIAFAVAIAGCEFDNLKDQEYGPTAPGNPTDTTGNGGDTNQVSITISPTTAELMSGETQQFVATVSDGSTPTLSWQVASGVGTIDANGLYQAPSFLAADESVTVMVLIASKPSVRATASLTIRMEAGSGEPGDTAKEGEICFERQVLPLLNANCVDDGCHNSASAKEGYVFETYEGILRGIDTSRSDPNDVLRHSELYEKITEDDDKDRMPPPPEPALTSEQISIIEQWIRQGARKTICPEPGGACDTNNVSYSAYIDPLVETYCGGKCHGSSASNPGAGFRLVQYDDLRQAALSGRLVPAVSHSTEIAESKWMPQGAEKLPDCAIAKITAWVNQGARNN